MPVLSVEISDEFNALIQKQVASGVFKSPSDVIEASLQLLKEEEEDAPWKLYQLRKAIQEGIDSPDAEGDVFAQIREELGLPARAERA